MTRRTTRATADALASISAQASTSNLIAPSTAMYMTNQYNHPAFNKLLLGPNLSHNGKSQGSTGALPKPPKAPEKPLMPYMRYSRKVWEEVKANQPELKLWEVGKIIGKMWRELPGSDKQLYMDEYEREKSEYQDLLKSYHNSPAYQGYLQAKGRAEAIEAEARAAERDDLIMSIEPADDGTGDADEGFSVKHIAAARFQRNHRLMQDILSDSSVVPCGRGIVTEQRLDILRGQVQSLDRHLTKLQNELCEIEEKHVETKRKWKENSRAFAVEMKRLRNMSPQEYYTEHKKQQAAKAQALKDHRQAPETEEKKAMEGLPASSTVNERVDATESSIEKDNTNQFECDHLDIIDHTKVSDGAVKMNMSGEVTHKLHASRSEECCSSEASTSKEVSSSESTRHEQDDNGCEKVMSDQPETGMASSSASQ